MMLRFVGFALRMVSSLSLSILLPLLFVAWYFPIPVGSTTYTMLPQGPIIVVMALITVLFAVIRGWWRGLRAQRSLLTEDPDFGAAELGVFGMVAIHLVCAVALLSELYFGLFPRIAAVIDYSHGAGLMPPLLIGVAAASGSYAVGLYARSTTEELRRNNAVQLAARSALNRQRAAKN